MSFEICNENFKGQKEKVRCTKNKLLSEIYLIKYSGSCNQIFSLHGNY